MEQTNVPAPTDRHVWHGQAARDHLPTPKAKARATATILGTTSSSSSLSAMGGRPGGVARAWGLGSALGSREQRSLRIRCGMMMVTFLRPKAKGTCIACLALCTRPTLSTSPRTPSHTLHPHPQQSPEKRAVQALHKARRQVVPSHKAIIIQSSSTHPSPHTHTP